MASGKPGEAKALKVTPNTEAQLWRAYVHSEEIASHAWKSKWGWILVEYEKRRVQLDDVSKKSIMNVAPKKSQAIETRTIKPFPNSVAHDCGWLASKPEFKLEKYGSDVSKGMPFVSLSGV